MSGSSLFASLGAALHFFPSPPSSLRVSGSVATSLSVLSAFETELASRLEQLKLTDEAGYVSAAWLCQAIDVALSMHSYTEAFVPDLQLSVTQGNGKWLDEYLDGSVKLLDVCNVLRDSVDDVQKYRTFLDSALHSLENGSMGKAQLLRANRALLKSIGALKRRNEDLAQQNQRRIKLETCSSMLRRIGEKFDLADICKGNFFGVVYAAQITTVFVCGVLAAALCVKSRGSLSTLSIAGQAPWVFSLSSLQQRVKEQLDKKKPKGTHNLLNELEREESSVYNLQDLIEKTLLKQSFPLRDEQAKDITQAVDNIRKSSGDVGAILTTLEQRMSELFRMLISSRLILLDIYTYSRFDLSYSYRL
eukprot:c30856_g1_i1 orf=96-1181(+)